MLDRRRRKLPGVLAPGFGTRGRISDNLVRLESDRTAAPLEVGIPLASPSRSGWNSLLRRTTNNLDAIAPRT